MKLIAPLMFILFCFPCSAEQVVDAELLEFGTYTSKSCEFMAGLIDGNYTLEDDGKLIEQTTDIPANLGTSFGLRYRINGEPDGESVSVDVLHKHSEVTDADSGEKRTVTKWNDTAWINKKSITRFCFGEQWEIAPGIWVISVNYQGRELLSKEFRVIK